MLRLLERDGLIISNVSTMILFQAIYNGPYTIQSSGINQIISGQAGEQIELDEATKKAVSFGTEEESEFELNNKSNYSIAP